MHDHICGERQVVLAYPLRNSKLERMRASAPEFIGARFHSVLKAQLDVIESGVNQLLQPLAR